MTDGALDAWLDTLEPKGVTDFTVTDKRALRQEIVQVRKDGFAITQQEWRRGYHAAAVPLKRYDGVAIGALCVAVWMEDSSAGSAAERHVPALTEEARVLQPQLL
jgi:IclR family pca regulon transcriptional regulator